MGQKVSNPAFVGRTEEIAALDGALGAVPSDGVATFLVAGDAGIGKSRLVEELCERAKGHGWLMATGYCSPVDGQSRPYGPLVGILRELGGAVGGEALAPVCRALGLGMVGNTDQPADLQPTPTSDLAKTRLFDTILAGVAGLARQSPLLLIFEDLHWADSATIDLIDVLTRNLGPAPVMLVATYRSDELLAEHPTRMLVELGRHGRVTQLQLDGLDREGIVTLLAGILGREPDWVLADAVYARSEGNPFFAEELAAARETSILPAHLRDMIMLRVGRLSEGARHVLGVLAVVGASADHRLLAAICEPEVPEFDTAIAETVDQRLLVVDATGSRYQFRHILIREAVYGALLPGRRARLHHQIAACLSAQPDLLPAGLGHADVELAGHWWAAAEWAEALRPLLRAASAAESVFAFAEADAHLDRALAAWDRIADPTGRAGIERIDLLERAATTAYFGASADRAVKLARAAVDEIDASVEPRRAALALARLGRNLAAVDTHASFEELQKACALLSEGAPSVERARVLAEKARLLMMLSRNHEAVELCREAISTAKKAGARLEEGHATNTLGCCLTNLGQPTEGIAMLQAALEIAEELGSPDDLNRAYNNLSAVLFNAGRLQDAVAIVLDAAAMGQEIGGIRFEGAALNSAEALVNLGQWDKADAMLTARGPLPGICVNTNQLLIALMALRRGRLEEARRALVAADAMTAGQGDVQTRGSYHVLQAGLALEERRPREASEEIDQALALVAASDDEFFGPEMCAVGIRALADAHEDVQARRTGSPKDKEKVLLRAAGLVEEAERFVNAPFERGGQCAPQPRAFAMVCRAEASRLHGSDPTLWETAATAWDELSMPYHAAYCRWRQAAALLATRSGRREAAALLDQAWLACENMGAVPLQRNIEQLAQRARISLSTDAVLPDGAGQSVASDLGLTSREVEVLGHLAAGKTDAQIAQQLFISKKTVSVHVSNLLRKLDVTNRFEAGEIAQQVGLGNSNV